MNQKLIRIKSGLIRQSPSILTGLAITGVPTTVVLAVRATPAAMRLIYEESINLDTQPEDMTVMQIVKAAWKPYIPAIASGVLTIVCILGSHKIHAKRNAAIAGLYSVAVEGLKEYQRKVIDTIGEKKEQQIRDDIAQDRINRDPPEKGVIFAGGDVLFYDAFSGRYFKSDMERIRQSVNDFNLELLNEMYKPANDFYDILGLEPIDGGRNLGWNVENGLLALDFSTKLITTKGSQYEGEPCIVIGYRMEPRFL